MNPFVIAAYKSPEYFCDREKETQTLVNSITNGVNIVLYSLRRMGKTGLIKHVFNHLSLSTDYQLLLIEKNYLEKFWEELSRSKELRQTCLAVAIHSDAIYARLAKTP